MSADRAVDGYTILHSMRKRRHHSSCRCCACERGRERAKSRALEEAKRKIAEAAARQLPLLEKRG